VDSQSHAVPVKSIVFVDQQTLTAKIPPQGFTSGTVIRVKVVTASGVNSNQVSATVP
jgi:hypothetical protein